MVLGQLLAIIPGHPLRWVGRQLSRVTLQLGEVVERIGLTQFAGVDQTHEQVPRLGPIERAVKQSILAMQHGALQRPLADIVVERRARVAQECRQAFPVAQ